MRKLLLAALAAIALVCPQAAHAQALQTTSFGVPSNSGTITTAGDAVTLTVSGTQWATVRLSVGTGGVALTEVAEVSIDNGVNWLAAPYAKRVDLVTANPGMIIFTAAVGTQPVSGAAYEFPIPGNTMLFRIRASGGTGPAILTLAGGVPYVPGIPVVATIYDQTSGTNAALDSGTLEVTGWSQLYYHFTMNGGVPAFSLQEVDEAGTTLASLITATAAFSGGIGPGVTVGGTAGLVAATASIPIPRRMRFQSAAIAAQTSRIRLEARR